MNKTEREELRRLLRARFKLLRTDVAARKAELAAELTRQIEADFAAQDEAYAAAMDRLATAVREANRVANDIGRELYGADQWGTSVDKIIVNSASIPRPGTIERGNRLRQGLQDIEVRVKTALLELERQENELLTDLATTALDSAEAKAFFARIPSVTELVPAYRLKEITK